MAQQGRNLGVIQNKDDRQRLHANHEQKYNDSKHSKSKYFMPLLKPYQARLHSCNGDCGSQIAKIIDHCVHPKTNEKVTEVIQDIDKIISNAFWLFGYPLRTELIDLMGKTQLCYNKNTFFQQIYQSLKDPLCYIEGNNWTLDIIKLFKALKHSGNEGILNDLANKSCLQPNCSISQEIEQYYKKRKDLKQKDLWKQVAVKNALIAGFATSLNQNKEKKMKLIEQHGKQRKKLMDKLNELESEKSFFINEKEQELRIERIKKHPNFIEMKNRNLALTNQEILSIILYCDYDIFCNEMRESQRINVNSCQWKKLFHHLSCALYKIYLILHNDNDKFYKQYIKKRKENNLLFRGIRGVKIAENNKNEHSLHTLTSFTSDFNVAYTQFAKPDGMILSINNAYHAIYEGKLIAANVSWISQHSAESEFILLPTTLKNIRFINYSEITKDSQYYSCIYDADTVDIYEAMDYVSIDLKPVIWSVSQRMKPPTMWLGKKSPQHIEDKKLSSAAWIILIGGFITWECPICGVKSRMCEYSGCILDMSVECPSCRSLFLQFGDTNPDEFECYNLKCGTIKHKDLEKVSDDDKNEWEKTYSMGYRCRKCGMRQRKAQFDRYKDPIFMEKAATKYIDAVEREFKYEINFKKDKDKIKEMILFVMNPEHNKAYIDELLIKFPIIWDWVMQAPGVKDAINNRKGDILKMVAKVLDLPNWITPVITGEMNKDINKTFKSGKNELKKVEKSVVKGIKKIKKWKF